MKILDLIPRLLISGILFISISFTVNGQNIFQRTFGGSGDDQGYGIDETSDGGFILSGTTSSYGAGGDDIYIVKIDSNGNSQWSKAYGGSSDERCFKIMQLSDKGYIIIGGTYSFGQGDLDVYLVRIDSIGNHLWSKAYGSSALDEAVDVNVTNDGGFILAGYSFSSSGAGNRDCYVIKTNSNGNMQWNKLIGGSNYDGLRSAFQTSDGGYILSDFTKSYGAGVDDVLIIRLDSVGNLLSFKTYGGSNQDTGLGGLISTNDGGFAKVGLTLTFGAGNWDIMLVKTDGAGNLNWAKTYGGTNRDYSKFQSITQNNDNGYSIIARTESFGQGANDILYIKTDSVGNLVSATTFGGTQDDIPNSIINPSSGGHLIFGSTANHGLGGDDMYLLRIEDGGLNCNGTTVSPSVSSPNLTVGNHSPSINSGGVEVVANTITTNITESDTFICKPCNTFAFFGSSSSGTAISFLDSSTNATNWTWDFGDGQYSNLQNPTHVYLTPGNYTVCLVVTKGTCQDTYCMSIDVQSGIFEVDNQNMFSIFPNPANDQLSIQINLNTGSQLEYQIVNMYGQEMASLKQFPHAQVTNNTNLDISKLSPGMYFIRLATSEWISVQEFLVIR